MSYKSHRPDSFCNYGFQSVAQNLTEDKECSRHGTYSSRSFGMGRTYGSSVYFMLFFNGLKSVVTIFVEATRLWLHSGNSRVDYKIRF